MAVADDFRCVLSVLPAATLSDTIRATAPSSPATRTNRRCFTSPTSFLSPQQQELLLLTPSRSPRAQVLRICVQTTCGGLEPTGLGPNVASDRAARESVTRPGGPSG